MARGGGDTASESQVRGWLVACGLSYTDSQGLF